MNANTATFEQKQQSSRNSILVWAGLGAAGCLSAALVLGVAAALFLFQNEAAEPHTQYHQIAPLVLDPLPSAAEEGALSPQELHALVQRRISTLDEIAASGSRFAPIAARESASQQRIFGLLNDGTAARQLGGGAARWAAGSYADSEQQRSEAGWQMLDGLLSGLAQVDGIEQAGQQMWADKIELATHAQEFNASPTSRMPLSLHFVAHADQPKDSYALRLTNSRSKTLRDVTVIVRLEGRDKKSRVHVYYVPVWTPGEDRFASYSTGLFGYLGTTVPDVQRVRVQLMSPNLSTNDVVFEQPAEGWPIAVPR